MSEHEIPDYWEQSLLIAKNPALGADFFDRYLKAFVKTVLGYSDKVFNSEGGILGVVKVHYGCVEAQGRGSLHYHMLVWVEGALNPDEIRKKVMEDGDWGQRLLQYLDDTISNTVPQDPLPDLRLPEDKFNPCSVRGTDLDEKNEQLRLGLRRKDVGRLAERVQRHRHTHICYKYYKPGELRKCHFNLGEENFRAESVLDKETGKVQLRCLDGLVNNFNMTALEAVRRNMDIQFIGSGASAKAMICYFTDYITKSQLKTHVAYAALQAAVKKCEQVNKIEDEPEIKSKRLLQECAYALVSHQEMSAQQVMSYLLGFEDHYTSHVFQNLYWRSFERYVQRLDPIEISEPLREVELADGFADQECDDGEECALREGEHEGRTVPEVDYDQMAELDLNDEAESLVSTEDEEEVSIKVNEDGSLTELADQICDYTQRPVQVEYMCLWDFVANTEKVLLPKGDRACNNCEEGSVGEGEDRELNVDEVDTSDDGNGSLEKDINEEGAAVPEETKGPYRFLVRHKESGRKGLRVREKKVVPVPIGPAIPRRDMPERYERFCRLMLIPGATRQIYVRRKLVGKRNMRSVSQ